MPNLDLQEYTLGERHKHYNKVLNNILQQDSMQPLSQVNYNDTDLENFLKIDIACFKKNVSYLLEILKCEDMLYVKRALKKSVWLITDEQYGNIVNPNFLHSQVFPWMSSKAINKFSLYIRLNLKHECRVDEFFNYYKNTNLNIAIKWLPNCSIEVIENATATYTQMINVNILKRLCEKSIKVLQIFVEKQMCSNKVQVMKATMFLMKNHLEEYLNIVQSLHDHECPKLGTKFTRMIMKKAPQRILDNFEKFAHAVHLQTFIKFIKPKNIAPFLLQIYRNQNLRYWITDENLKPFILAMPQEIRTDFVKQFLINRNFDHIDVDVNKRSCFTDLLAREKNYHWYKYMPFEAAFENIKKLTKRESSPNERNLMLIVLLHSAGHNMQHIETLLHFYRNKHINEPVKFKSNFVYALIEQFRGVIFNISTWKILNELFLSMEVYSESTNNVQFCNIVAITHKIFYNEVIPEILEKKFSFQTLNHYQKNLSEAEKEILFNYLYKYVMKPIKELNIVNEPDFKKALRSIKNVLMLLSDWEKELVDFPLVLNEISEFINTKRVNFCNTDLSSLYNVNKSWRRHLFHFSLDLCLSDHTCVNALKHNPKLLMSSQDILKSVHSDKTSTFKQFLNKMRIYWPTLADESISICLNEIESKINNKALRHIIILLPQKSLHGMIKKYAPEDEIINWNNFDEALLNIRKCIAKCMHTARPQPSLEVVLWYAKGDYLQYAVPSLTATLYNISCTAFKQEMKVLIKNPVSLQKYSIRIANYKLSNEEIIKMFSNAWKVTKNKSIRADIFKCSFKLLCNEKNVSAINNIWALLQSFIGTLTDDENKVIYSTLAEVNKVPLCVRVHFWKTSYQFFNSLPAKSEYCDSINRVISSSANFMEIIDVDFIAEILREDFERNLTGDLPYDYIELICSCLLSTDNNKSQDKRYINLFHPIMEQCISSWNTKWSNEYLSRWKLCQLLKNLCINFYDIVLKNEKVIPDVTFYKIHNYLEQNLPTEENYLLLRTWRFSYTLIKIVGADGGKICTSYQSGVFNTHSGFNDYLISEVIPQFGVELLQFLKEDIELYCSSIYISFTDALKLMWEFFNFNTLLQLHLLKSILNFDLIESYLVVLNLVPKYVVQNEIEIKNEILNMIDSHSSPEVKMRYYNHCSEALYSRFIF